MNMRKRPKRFIVFRKRMDNGLTTCHAYKKDQITAQEANLQFPDYGISFIWDIPVEAPFVCVDARFVKHAVWYE